ncbi:MAG: CoA pyrophosphatase [Rhodothermales bacterium]|nr:CoA pyrophosphatase [Rhodothermales bacterium]
MNSAGFPHETIDSVLSDALSGDLPGQRAQFLMAPAHRRLDTGASVVDRPCREAAVLALFYPDAVERTADARRLERDSESHILLTIRPPGLSNHAGQVALPGGRREENETLEETALRETHEEVAIAAPRVRIVGRLSPLFVPPSAFCVYPFVGVMDEKPDMGVTSDEVARVFGAPLRDLTLPETRKTTVREIRGRRMHIPYFDLDGQFVWGATAMMLAELAALLNPSWLRSDPLDGLPQPD